MARLRTGRVDKLDASTRVLLELVPSMVCDCYPLGHYGLSEGVALLASHWRARISQGAIRPADMRASIVPVATLASAMVEALLRAADINDRAAAFERLADDSNRVLTGRPHAIILQSGIL